MTGRLLPRVCAVSVLAAALWFPPAGFAQMKSSSQMMAAPQTTEALLDQMRSRGAKITNATRAQVMRRAGDLANRAGGGKPACGENACICTGSECLDVIDSNVCNADTFHCVPSDDGPVCVCETK